MKTHDLNPRKKAPLFASTLKYGANCVHYSTKYQRRNTRYHPVLEHSKSVRLWMPQSRTAS